jgi:hypothetical protein
VSFAAKWLYLAVSAWFIAISLVLRGLKSKSPAGAGLFELSFYFHDSGWSITVMPTL